jgi:peptide/nickel transport system substrate-binding protein
MTAWQMVGRPERLDPDEFVFNLFHSSTAEKGYDFVGYSNPEYDKLAEQQRTEIDKEKRQKLLYKLQEIIARDTPYLFLVYPHANYAYNNEIWDQGTITDAKGIGIKNYWTFIKASPKGSQKDMILNTLATVQSINPLYISGGTDSWITELVWDRLMRIDAAGLPQPYVAEKVEWKDGLTVVATLRSGLKWHDGKPLTVDDVIFSFKAPAGSMSPMYKPFVSGIKEVTAIGDNQVQFRLSQPNAAFETSSLAKLNLIPQHIWDPVLKDLEAKGINAEKYQEDQPVGSGPFKFVNWKRSEEIVLRANQDHFDAPKMQRWILRDLPNVSAAVGALQNGEINFLSDYTGDPVLLKETVEQNKKLSLTSTIVVGFRFLAPNERRAPFDDPAFRRALATAVAKDQVLQNIYHGFATAADSHVSKALEFWHAPGLPDLSKGDIAGARKILSDAGYEWDPEGHLLYPKGKQETLQAET